MLTESMATLAPDAELMAQLERTERLFVERDSLVHAFIPESGRFERLRGEVLALARRYPAPHGRPACYGILVGVKDIFRVDGFVTQAGSRLPPEALGGAQAACVSRLINAGALILGKTVTTEFAYFAPGLTRNPRNLEHTPGGSSSGSAAAVAAGLAPLTLGTQTIGSIIRPAAFCGVVGLKPTYDRISKDGVIPLSPSLDHVGYFTPDVAMARRVAASLYEQWSQPAASAARPVLGVPEGPYLDCASADALIHFRGVCAALRGAGYTVRAVPLMDDFEHVRARHDLIMSAEAARVHADWFGRFKHLYADRTADLILRGQQVSDAQLAQARDESLVWRKALDALMQQEGIDLWISPPARGAAPRGLESTGDPVMNLPWTQAGLPTINLPAGTDSQGLPLGLQVTGRWGTDEALLSWAEELEGLVRRP